jgi:hypothetical protein
MAKKSYKVASEEGAERYHEEVGTVVELDLADVEEQAVIAAGWLEHDKKKGKE